MSKYNKSAIENPTLSILSGEKTPAPAPEKPAPVQIDEALMKNFKEPDKKTRSKRVQILITEEMFSKVKATATAGKTSVNEVVNQALAHFYS